MINLSAIDEQRFGVRTARATLSPGDLAASNTFCQEKQVQFLIARCSTTHLSLAQDMEEQGFQLMDTLFYYKYNFVKKSLPDYSFEIAIRPARPEDSEAVRHIAAESFKGYYGHYHADDRLPRAACDAAYVDWAVRSVESREVADEVFVAEVDHTVAAFATMRQNSSEEGEGVLFGVAPGFQGRGIYRQLIMRGQVWCVARNHNAMVVSTQVTNLAVQKVWGRLGFEPDRSYYTFHKWFD